MRVKTETARPASRALLEYFCPRCGGEVRSARRLEDGLIVSYMRCTWCGEAQKMFTYDPVTRVPDR